MKPVELFLVDENDVALRERAAFLRKCGFNCYTYPDTKLLLKMIDGLNPRFIILKPKHKDEAIHFLTRLKAYECKIYCIVLSESKSLGDIVEIIKAGAYDYIPIPFSNNKLILSIKKAVRDFDSRRCSCSTSLHTSDFFGLVGRSAQMSQIYKKVVKIARTNVSVLICGESGTGKELLARAIHANSRRAGNQFIPVSCNALPSTLIESELFGFERGAFTGARSAKKGLIELSHKGTLFLDEITEIEPDIQPKLLRFLQEKTIRRIGGLREIEIDTRVIAATNRDPLRAVEEGIFREDLFYRLDVVRFELPPLRDRKEDIPLLVDHFIRKFNKHLENVIEGIDSGALEILYNYNWPGNVRQLENLIKRVMVLCDEPVIKAKHLTEFIFQDRPSGPAYSISGNKKFKELKKSFVEEFEKRYLLDMIEKHKGNLSKIAREAGVNRRTIYRIMEQYGIRQKK